MKDVPLMESKVMVTSQLGENIKQKRKVENLTQEQLSEKANVPYTTLIKIENGFVKNPKIETIAKISKALNIPIDRLIYGQPKIKGN